MHELQATFDKAGTPTKVAAVLKSLYGRAIKGDVIAAKIWLERVCGKPRQDVVVQGDGSITELVTLIRETQQRLMAIPEVRKVMAREVKAQ